MIKLTEQDIKWYNKGQKKSEIIHQFGIVYNELLVYYEKIKDKLGVNTYQFIIEEFIPLFNKPDSPWQKPFWEWMEKKGYAYIEGNLKHLGGMCYSPNPPVQMLTGYIIKYLESDRESEE